MEVPLRIVELPNGLIFRFLDRTRHYYGGFFHVKVEVCCELDVTPDLCASYEQYAQAVEVLGNTVSYTRALDRMGVLESDIPNVREQMISQFIESSHAYLCAPSFPSGFIRAELDKLRKKRPGQSVRFSS